MNEVGWLIEDPVLGFSKTSNGPKFCMKSPVNNCVQL